MKLIVLALLLNFAAPLAACTEEYPSSEARTVFQVLAIRLAEMDRKGALARPPRIEDLTQRDDLSGSFFSARDYRVSATGNPRVYLLRCESQSRGWIYEGRVELPAGKLTFADVTPPRSAWQWFKDTWPWLLAATWLFGPPLMFGGQRLRRGYGADALWPWLAASSLWVFFWTALTALPLLACPGSARIAGYTLSISGCTFLLACVAMPPRSLERVIAQIGASIIVALLAGALAASELKSGTAGIAAALTAFVALVCITLHRFDTAHRTERRRGLA